MPKRAIISVINDLQGDQRVTRICDALQGQGYDLLLVGRYEKDSQTIDRPYRVKRFRLIFNRGFAFYAEYNIRLFLLLLSQKKDLLYANDLDTLLPNYLISRLLSVPLVYDSHEYFTEVPELINRPGVQSFWLGMEKFIFPSLKNVITVNKDLAQIYCEKYKVPVSVIRNVPEINQRVGCVERKIENKQDAILIYQGSLNIGRGIELMIDSMEILGNCKLLVVGSGDISEDLKRRVEAKHLAERVIFKGRMDPTFLRELTPRAALGFSLEEDMGLNYRYALPNKIFDYIHACIPVIVSDLPIMRGFVLENKVGEVLTERNPMALAKLVRRVISEKNSYQPYLEATATRFNWNNEKFKLLKMIENLE